LIEKQLKSNKDSGKSASTADHATIGTFNSRISAARTNAQTGSTQTQRIQQYNEPSISNNAFSETTKNMLNNINTLKLSNGQVIN